MDDNQLWRAIASPLSCAFIPYGKFPRIRSHIWYSKLSNNHTTHKFGNGVKCNFRISVWEISTSVFYSGTYGKATLVL